MKDKSFFIKSYGCQMNEYDSEKISSLLLKDGYSNISDINKADLIVFNTCNIKPSLFSKVKLPTIGIIFILFFLSTFLSTFFIFFFGK